MDESGKASDVRLALCSVGETPLLALQAAKTLVGQVPTPEWIAKAAAIAATEDVDPGGDIHCSVEFRRHLVEVVSRRALTQAFERAQTKGA
jgi:carbon-monoxide dehydrogenase medium subunit